jgi:WD40 repeat protein
MSDTASTHPSLTKLAAYLEGRLPAGEHAVLQDHVAACASCRRLLQQRGEEVENLEEGTVRPVLTTPGEATRLLEAPEPTGRPQQAASAAGVVGLPVELADHPRYRILAPLGAGGMGAVFKAEHRLMERIVAVKVIRQDLISNPQASERFRQEVKAAARLSHPNIVTAHDADQAGDVHFLVMEYIEGISLDRYVRQHGPLPVVLACDLIRQAALGLQHAHERGMIHRDIKPANLLLTPGRQLKILDFGLARFVSEAGGGPGTITAFGVVIGTPDYMAPEQASQARRADIRADIYALGCTFYYLLTGQAPFPGGTALEKLLLHQHQQPAPLAQVRADVPTEVARVVERMMAKDPNQRFQAPREVVRALDTLAVTARPPERPTVELPRPARPAVPPPRPAGYLTVCVAIGLVLATLAALAGLNRWLAPPAESDGGPQLPGLGPLPDLPAEIKRLGDGRTPFTSVAFAFSPQGPHALVAGADRVLRLWALDSGEEIARLEGHTDEVLALDVADDGRTAVSGSRDGKLHLWDLGTGKLLQALDGHAGPVHGVRFAWDGKQVFSASTDGVVALWDPTADDRPKNSIKDEHCSFSGIALDRINRLAVLPGSDRTLRVWDVRRKEWKQTATFAGADSGPSFALWSSEGRFLLSGGNDRALRLWRWTTQRELCRMEGHTDRVTCAALTKDNCWALSGSADGTVRLWDVGTAEERARLEGHSGAVLAVAFTDDGQRALSGGADGTVRIWRLPEGRESKPAGYLDRVGVLALSPDGAKLAGTFGDEVVRLYDIVPDAKAPTLSEPSRVLEGAHTSTILCLAFSPDGRTLASGGWDKTVVLWDVEAGRPRKTLSPFPSRVRAVTFLPDGRALVAASADTAGLWDVASGQEHGVFGGHQGAVLCVACAADGRVLATGGADRTIRLWDVASRRPRVTLAGHEGAVSALVFAPNSQALYSASEDGTARCWDVASGKALGNPVKHEGPVHALAVSPDGRTVASGGADRLIHIWGSGPRRGHSDPVSSMVFTSEGKTLLSTSPGGRVFLWEITPRGGGP